MEEPTHAWQESHKLGGRCGVFLEMPFCVIKLGLMYRHVVMCSVLVPVARSSCVNSF